MHVLPVFLIALLGGQQVLDDFRYADTAAARAVWTADEGSPPVEVVTEQDRPILRLSAPFAAQPKLRRAVVDRRVHLDLSSPAGFVVEAAIDDPALIGGLTLYFRSGSGWYSAGKPAGKKGWRTLRFAKASFTVEGTPTGWDKIDGIRLSAWRPPGKGAGDTDVRFRRLAAFWHDVALVVPVQTPSRTEAELAVAKEAAHRLEAMSDELGLGSDLLDEEAIARGDLGRRRIVVLPSNFTPGDACIAALAKFVKSGGKLVIYAAANVPLRLREALQLAASPNSAVQESDRGAIFDYDVPADTREARNQLAATFGRLEPPLWKEMAQAELDRAGKVGPYETVTEVFDAVHPCTPAVLRRLNRARHDWKLANDLFAQGAYHRVIESAQAAHDSLVKAYLAAVESPPREGRAVWNHSGTGAFPEDPDSWNRSAKLLAENGFNMVFPNMLWGGLAHYPSKVLPRSVTFRRFGDQIQQCCAAAKRWGIEVHVWKVDFNLTTAPKDFIEKLRRQGRTQVSVKGEPSDWLCPSNPDNRKLELDSLLEVARKYPIDGLHLDYIRYPGREYCYCDGCRQRFEAASGRKVVSWPKDCFAGDRKDEYNEWRCRQISELVKTISREAKKVRPGLKISAAVFGSYPGCRESVAQDWPAWVKAGYLDFVCPMDYTADDAEFASLVRSQAKLVGGRVPLYVGIGATATGLHLTPDQVINQIIAARSLGASGFSIFNFSPQTAAVIIPAVGQGAGSRRAVPPHRTP
jgi:uncharacterized lipoprotein YddW (UPF0748 family)